MDESGKQPGPQAERPQYEVVRRVGPILLLLGLAILATTQMSAGSQVPEGSQVPPLRVTLDDGATYEIAGAPGEVVVINFWATWCGPCRKEAPVLSAVHRGGVRVVGISVDNRPLAQIAAAARELGMDYPVAIDDQNLTGRFKVQVVPTTYVVAADGVVVLSRVGMVSEADLADAVGRARERI